MPVLTAADVAPYREELTHGATDKCTTFGRDELAAIELTIGLDADIAVGWSAPSSMSNILLGNRALFHRTDIQEPFVEQDCAFGIHADSARFRHWPFWESRFPADSEVPPEWLAGRRPKCGPESRIVGGRRGDA